MEKARRRHRRITRHAAGRTSCANPHGWRMSRAGSRKDSARPSAGASQSASDRDLLPDPWLSESARAVHVSSKQDFDEFVRLAGWTVAEPPWFATPVEAKEDGGWYVVAFHVPARDQAELSVTGNDHSLIVWGARRGVGPRREMRMCPLPDPIDPKSTDLVRTVDVLTVRVRKKHADRTAKRIAVR